MPVQAVALVLRQHHDLAVAAVDEVGQHEVDQPVDARRTARPAWPGRRSAASGACPRRRPGRSRQNLVRHDAHAIPCGPLTRPRIRPCASTCSPASTRPRSTAGPACTSSTSPASCAGWSTSGCTAWGRRATSRASRRTACRTALADANPALRTLGTDLSMVAGCEGADLVHSHTWYANLAGHLAKLLYGVPHVMSAHSLEPLRPWKAEQLGGGYALSSWAEQTAIEAADAVIAVSGGMRDDVLRCYPAVDPGPGARGAQRHRHRGVPARHAAPTVLQRHGIDPDRPSVVFVGRITRQKGLPHLLRAALSLDPSVQLVLCAGSPDTDEILAEVDGARRGAAAGPGRRRLDPGDAAQAGRHPGPHPRHGVRLPVGLRADGHRQPRGDGLRGAGGGHRDRRHPGGGGRRRDRAAGADRAAERRQRHPAGHLAVRGGPRGGAVAGAGRPGRGPARWGWPGGAARSRRSPGRPSPPGRWTSTAGCSDAVRPRPAALQAASRARRAAVSSSRSTSDAGGHLGGGDRRAVAGPGQLDDGRDPQRLLQHVVRLAGRPAIGSAGRTARDRAASTSAAAGSQRATSRRDQHVGRPRASTSCRSRSASAQRQRGPQVGRRPGAPTRCRGSRRAARATAPPTVSTASPRPTARSLNVRRAGQAGRVAGPGQHQPQPGHAERAEPGQRVGQVHGAGLAGQAEHPVRRVAAGRRPRRRPRPG